MPLIKITILVSLLLMSACSVSPRKNISQTLDSKQHQKQIYAQTHWRAQGRLAVNHESKGGQASFTWLQQGDRYEIMLFGPLGSGAVTIKGDTHGVALYPAKGQALQAPTAEQLLLKLLGWQVPVSGLRYWMRGVPVPNQPIQSEKIDDQGLLTLLAQQKWMIEYQQYNKHANLRLPSKLRLSQGAVTLKMIVTTWKPLPIHE